MTKESSISKAINNTLRDLSELIARAEMQGLSVYDQDHDEFFLPDVIIVTDD